MWHEFTEEAWESFLSGALTAETSALNAHLRACAECRAMVERLRQSEVQFKQATHAARQQLALQDEQIYHGLRGIFLRLLTQEAEVNQQQLIEPWLRALEATLSELCGNQTAPHMMQTAARRSPARALENIETANWQPFLEHVTALTQVVCGEVGSQLVTEIGRFPLVMQWASRESKQLS
jgi:hypothetical protein